MIAQENFKLILEDGRQIALQLRLVESGAFQYGNQTSVVWDDGNGYEQLFDTRYESGCSSPEAFHEWSFEFVKSRVRETVKVERV